MNDEYDLIKKTLLNHLNSKSNCSIGSIVSVNSSPVSVDIQPAIKYFDKTEGFLESPILKNIPIAQISNNISSMRMPINPGDVGIIIWFDREVYSWLKSSSTRAISPDGSTLYNESACIFIPLIQKFSKSPNIKSTGVDIFSSDVSLMTQLISTLNNISTTLADITSLLTDLTTFNTALIAAGAPYAGAPTTPVLGAYPIAVTAAATASNLTIVSIASSISTVTTAIGNITTQMTTFKGAQ